eukprot:6893527-Pyramimonas_sp.AAC.1
MHGGRGGLNIPTAYDEPGNHGCKGRWNCNGGQREGAGAREQESESRGAQRSGPPTASVHEPASR